MRKSYDYKICDFSVIDIATYISVKIGEVVYSNRNGVYRPFYEAGEEIPDEEKDFIRKGDAVIDVQIIAINKGFEADIYECNPYMYANIDGKTVVVDADVAFNADEVVEYAQQSLCKLLAWFEEQASAGNIPGEYSAIPPGDN